MWYALRAFAVAPVLYMYLDTLRMVPKPERVGTEGLLGLLYGQGSDLAIMVIALVGAALLVSGMVGYVKGFAAGLSLYVVMSAAIAGGLVDPSVILVAVSSTLAYVAFDTMATAVRGKGFALPRELSAHGLVLLVAFAAAKYFLPIALGMLLYHAVTTLPSLSLRGSYMERLLWELVTESAAGRFALLVGVLFLGAYLLRAISVVVLEYALPSRSWALRLLSEQLNAVIAGVQRVVTPWLRGWYALLASLVFYPVVYVTLLDLAELLGLGNLVAELSGATAGAVRAAVFILVCVTAWKLSGYALTALETSGPKGVLAALIPTVLLAAYLALVQGFEPVVNLLMGKPTPSVIDAEAYGEYYVWYTSLSRAVRYVLTVMGVVP